MNKSELEILAEIDKLLSKLDKEAQNRTMLWLSEKHSVNIISEGILEKLIYGIGALSHNGNSVINLLTPKTLEGFKSVAHLLDCINAKNSASKVLIVAVFLQEKMQLESLTGRDINKELKQLGIGISNITQAIGSLVDRRPPLVKILSKGGTSQQSRKKYLVMPEGVEAVRVAIEKKVLKV